MPEVLWKAYIDFEIEQGEHERVRILYESLLRRTQHIKVKSIVYYGNAINLFFYQKVIKLILGVD
jgi:TRAP-type mannitol/chloroaromatic compound transport system permease small subunit